MKNLIIILSILITISIFLMGGENFTEVLIYLTILLILFPFVTYILSKRDKFNTRLESGNIKFLRRGDSLWKIIHNVHGKKLNEEGEFTDGKEKKSFFNSVFGMWWIGIPPFASVHSFEIKKEKENPAGSKPEEWITTGKEIPVSSLRYSFPRPFVFRAVELKDRTTVDLLVVCKFEVVNPYRLVFIFKGDFFDNTGSMLSAKVNDKVKIFKNIADFIKAPKSEEDGFLSDLKKPDSDFNSELIKLIGLRLVGVNVSKYDPSDKNVLEATNAEAIAKLKAKAIIAEAGGYARRIGIETEADASRIKKLGEAQGAKIREVVANLASSLGKPDTVVTSAANILKAEQVAGSKIITWVESGSAQPVISVGGGQ